MRYGDNNKKANEENKNFDAVIVNLNPDGTIHKHDHKCSHSKKDKNATKDYLEELKQNNPKFTVQKYKWYF